MISSESKGTESDSPESIRKKAREEAVRYIGIAAKTSGAVSQRLRRSGYPEDVIERTVDSLRSDGYLRDEGVARALMKRSEGRSTESIRALRYRMMQRGVPGEQIERSLEDVPPDRDTAESLLRSRFPEHVGCGLSASPSDVRATYARLARFLASRGYNPDTIGEVLRKVMDGIDDHE